MKRFLSSASIICLGAVLAGPALAQQASTTAPSALDVAERQQLRDEVRAYLLENPEVIMEALQVLEERRELQAKQSDLDTLATNQAAIYDDGHSFVAGNPEGDVTIVEFSDYRCGYCKKAHPEITKLLKSDPNIRLIVKEFPILGPDSIAAGRMALAALAVDPKKFNELHEALIAYPGSLTEEVAYRIAENAGYAAETLKEAAESDETSRKLEENYRLAQELGLRGTPSFIIGDEVIRGYVPAEDMEIIISETRDNATTSN
ncbi:MAG: DsbA family protein [Pseudomonadota bacterium]